MKFLFKYHSGLTSFGGSIAHLGYFRLELVEKRKWVSESQFGQLSARAIGIVALVLLIAWR